MLLELRNDDLMAGLVRLYARLTLLLVSKRLSYRKRADALAHHDGNHEAKDVAVVEVRQVAEVDRHLPIQMG